MKQKVAIVHDFFMKFGGAERVVKELIKIYPEASLYTLVYDENLRQKEIARTKITASFLQKLPTFLRKRYRFFFPFFPRMMESFDFTGYDLVISSSSAFSHGVITNLTTRHVCYYHSPTRYLWDWHANYLKEQSPFRIVRFILSLFLSKQRTWDSLASRRPEIVIANSKFIQERIKKFYRRESTVIYPPVAVEDFSVSTKHQDYYLFIGTLSPYKNVELAIRMFNKNGKKFKIIGEGKDINRLKEMAGPNIEFLGNVCDEGKKHYLAGAKAFVFPGIEDFGIAIVEAIASGKPVLAYGQGGALETVVDGVSGILFPENNIKSMEEAFLRLEANYEAFDPQVIRKEAEKFSREVFAKKIKTICEEGEV